MGNFSRIGWTAVVCVCPYLKLKHKLRSEKSVRQRFRTGVRFSPSPPHIRAKRQIFVFNIESPVGFVPAGLFSWAGEENGESWESPSDNDRGWRGAGGCFLMYNIEK